MITKPISAARVQAWRKKYIPQQMLASVWEQLSNANLFSMTIPNAKDRPVPNAVVMKVTDEFANGSYKTTMISLRRGTVTLIDGPNVAAGRENRNTMLAVSLYYNVKRIPRAMGDESVEGDINEFYRIAEQTSAFLTTDFGERTDYDMQLATLDGADISLTAASAWENSEKGSDIAHPLDPVFHPNVYWWHSSALTKNTWSATYATSASNLGGAIASVMTSSDTFNVKLLDQILYIAQRKIAPLGGVGGNSEIKWVLKISDGQSYQLASDAAAGSMQDRFKYTDKSIDRVITGNIGLYQGMLVIKDTRSPLANLVTSSVSFQFAQVGVDNRVPLAFGTTTGTCELAMLYGNGALGVAMKEDLTFKKQESMDYGFENSMVAIKRNGVRRIDLDTTDAATSARVNETSAIFLTVTTSSTLGG